MEARPSFFSRTLTWVAGFVLLAGIVAFVTAYAGRSSDDDAPKQAAPKATSPAGPQARPAAGKPGKAGQAKRLPAEIRVVAGKFILTAVARNKTGESWPLLHPNLKAGYTRASWTAGDIPVQPYPVSALEQARVKVDVLTPKQAVLQIALIPKAGTDVKGYVFEMVLRNVANRGAKPRWLVESWMPSSVPPVKVPGGEGLGS